MQGLVIMELTGEGDVLVVLAAYAHCLLRTLVAPAGQGVVRPPMPRGAGRVSSYELAILVRY
jgi:hypothetical protein